MKDEYLLLLPIGSMGVGDDWGPRTPLPLHATVMPWFSNDNIDNLDVLLGNLVAASACSGFELIGQKREAFGPKNEVMVTVLQKTPDLIRLHNKLLFLLARHNALPLETQWVGAGYVPHVTDIPQTIFPVKGKVVTSRLVLIHKDQKKVKRVVKVWGFLSIPF
mgnify:CR=1 FL=1